MHLKLAYFRKMVETLRKYWLLGFSGLLMVLIIGDQINHPAGLGPETKLISQEKNQSSEGDKEQGPEKSSNFSVSTVKVIVPFFNLDITTNLYLVHELNLLCELSFKCYIEDIFRTSSYFFTLFRLIIAPNAP